MSNEMYPSGCVGCEETFFVGRPLTMCQYCLKKVIDEMSEFSTDVTNRSSDTRLVIGAAHMRSTATELLKKLVKY